MRIEEVLVAGGGIGGLAAALATARTGRNVRLYERAPAFGEVGAGVQLGPNVVRHLDAWGLGAPLRAVAAFPDALRVRSVATGAELGRLALGERMQQRYGAPYATIHRADLHRLLLDATRAEPRVHCHLGVAIEGFADDGRTVTLRTGQGNAVEGDALIAADGVWSRLRRQLLGDAAPWPTGHLAYRALLPQQALPEPLRARGVTAWLGPRLHAVQYPVCAGRMLNLVVIVEGRAPDDLEHWDHAANTADLRVALHGACAPLQDTLQAVADARIPWRLWPLSGRAPVTSAGQMAQGLVALAGDAAHPMLPYLAQGAGMAIEDAAALQQALGMDALDMPLRLRRYALNRWQRNARVQARSWRNGRIFHATGPVRWGRDTAMRLLGARLLDVPWLYGGGAS